LDDAVDRLVSRDGQFLDVAQQIGQFLCRRGLGFVIQQRRNAGEYGVNLGQDGQGMVRLLGHVHLLVVAKQPVHEPRKLLLPLKSQRQQRLPRRLDFRAWQAKGAAGVLVFGQPVPPAPQQRLEQFFGLHLGG
jgi:hypothetical protein